MGIRLLLQEVEGQNVTLQDVTLQTWATGPIAPGSSVWIGFDPGRDKCGRAIVAVDSSSRYVIVDLAVVRSPQAVAQLQADCQRYAVQAIALGNSTTSRQWHQDLSAALSAVLGDAVPPLIAVDERNTTLEARDRYWILFPPRGLQRLIPGGLRMPPRPVDDVAALLLLERYFNF